MEKISQKISLITIHNKKKAQIFFQKLIFLMHKHQQHINIKNRHTSQHFFKDFKCFLYVFLTHIYFFIFSILSYNLCSLSFIKIHLLMVLFMFYAYLLNDYGAIIYCLSKIIVIHIFSMSSLSIYYIHHISFKMLF